MPTSIAVTCPLIQSRRIEQTLICAWSSALRSWSLSERRLRCGGWRGHAWIPFDGVGGEGGRRGLARVVPAKRGNTSW